MAFHTRYEVAMNRKGIPRDVGNPHRVVRTHGSAFGMAGIVL
jgi:hypothetical protein